MKLTHILLGSVFAWLTFVAQGYGGTPYTSRTAFQAAVGSYKIEEFENSPLVGDSSSGGQALLSFTDFNVATTPTAGKVLNVPAFGAVNSTPSGSKYLYIDTDIGFSGLTATFTFPQPKSAFGFDYSANFEPGNILRVTIDGQTFNIAGSQPNSPQFWGYVATSGQQFGTVAVVSQTIQSALGVDRVTFFVPEPSVLLLVFTAVFCFAMQLRGRHPATI